MKKCFYLLFFWAVSLQGDVASNTKSEETKVSQSMAPTASTKHGAKKTNQATTKVAPQKEHQQITTKKATPYKHHLWVKTGVLLLFPIVFHLWVLSFAEKEEYIQHVLHVNHLHPYGWIGSLFILFSLVFSFLSTKIVLVKSPKWYGVPTWWKENITYSLALFSVGLVGSMIFLFDLSKYNIQYTEANAEVRKEWAIILGICWVAIWLVEGCIAGIQLLIKKIKSKWGKCFSANKAIDNKFG